MAKKKATKKAVKKTAKKSVSKGGAAAKKKSKAVTAAKKSGRSTAAGKKRAAGEKRAAAGVKAPAKKKKATAKKKAAPAAKKATSKKKVTRGVSASKTSLDVVSAKNGATKKKKKAPVRAPAPVVEAPPLPKVPPLSKRISSKNLQAIRERLFERRAALLGSLGGLADNNTQLKEHAVQSGGDEIDAATYSVAADLSLRAAESESRELKEIELALSKLEDGSYGVCEATGKPIDVRRLLFMPAARLSLEAQEQLEKEQLYHDAEKGWVQQEF